MALLSVMAQDFDIYEGDGMNPFARTGDIALHHLKRVGARGVVIGHSEAGDAVEVVSKKLKTILKDDFFNKIIVLLGETWEEYEKSSEEELFEILKQKCEIVFGGIAEKDYKRLIVGYEPKWGSRGSGKEGEMVDIKLARKAVKILRDYFDNSQEIKFIYGGKSSPERTRGIMAQGEVDGLILSSACNTIEKTLAIAKAAEEAAPEKTKVLICNFKAYNLEESYRDYVESLRKLDDSFEIDLAPPYTDLRAAVGVL